MKIGAKKSSTQSPKHVQLVNLSANKKPKAAVVKHVNVPKKSPVKIAPSKKLIKKSKSGPVSLG